MNKLEKLGRQIQLAESTVNPLAAAKLAKNAARTSFEILINMEKRLQRLEGSDNGQ